MKDSMAIMEIRSSFIKKISLALFSLFITFVAIANEASNLGAYQIAV